MSAATERVAMRGEIWWQEFEQQQRQQFEAMFESLHKLVAAKLGEPAKAAQLPQTWSAARNQASVARAMTSYASKLSLAGLQTAEMLAGQISDTALTDLRARCLLVEKYAATLMAFESVVERSDDEVGTVVNPVPDVVQHASVPVMSADAALATEARPRVMMLDDGMIFANGLTYVLSLAEHRHRLLGDLKHLPPPYTDGERQIFAAIGFEP